MKPALKKNSEITAYLSDTGYGSKYAAGLEGTYHFASGFNADDDAGSDGGMEAKNNTNVTVNAASSSERPAGQSIMERNCRALLRKNQLSPGAPACMLASDAKELFNAEGK